MSKKHKSRTERGLADEYLNNATPDTELSSGERDDQPEEVEKNRVREAMAQPNKHTPGPWEICQMTEDNGPRHLAIRHAGQARRAICLVSGLSTVDEEDVANAALIASSPSLLVGLQLAVHHLENPGIPITPASLENLRAIIANAKGTP